MTRTELVEKYKHKLAGMLLEATTYRVKDAELSLYIRNMIHRADAVIMDIFNDCYPDTPILEHSPKQEPPANGVRGKTPLLPGVK